MSMESVRADAAETVPDPGADRQPINNLALVAAAMAALAIVGLFLAGMAIVAVFVVGAGHVALKQIEQRGERGRPFAVSALVVGYGIAVLSLVSALIYTFTR